MCGIRTNSVPVVDDLVCEGDDGNEDDNEPESTPAAASSDATGSPASHNTGTRVRWCPEIQITLALL